MAKRGQTTVGYKHLRKQPSIARAKSYAALTGFVNSKHRPTCRADCLDGPRPCPWVGCRYHLYLDITRIGTLTENFPGADVDTLTETCALDVADRGDLKLEELADLMDITKERVRQIEEEALRRLRKRIVDGSLDGLLDDCPGPWETIEAEVPQ